MPVIAAKDKIVVKGQDTHIVVIKWFPQTTITLQNTFVTFDTNAGTYRVKVTGRSCYPMLKVFPTVIDFWDMCNTRNLYKKFYCEKCRTLLRRVENPCCPTELHSVSNEVARSKLTKISC